MTTGARKVIKFYLVINCGSSSLKFSLYDSAALAQVWSGSISPIGTGTGQMLIKTNEGKILESRRAKFQDLDLAVQEVIKWLENKRDSYPLKAIGHRLVQGGPNHRQPEFVTPVLLKTLRQFVYLAPNHLPDELMAIKAFGAVFCQVPQVVCFDTAFHRDIPSVAKYYPLPEKYKKKGLMKYGFHGLSYQYILQELLNEDQLASKKKIIIAHLGNGASMAAVNNGSSVDTTMGISPIGGLVMGTRSGDLDPGALLFILKQDHLTVDQLDDLLSKKSGLKAIAGKSGVQELLEAEQTDLKAKEALRVFCYSAKKYIGSLSAAMGGLDMLVFTGGIGEHSSIIRERICAELEFMGIDLDKPKNTMHKNPLSKKNSRVAVLVIPTNEELMIARLVGHLLSNKKK
ncbi:acetate/propionate family kinase [Pedobacter sp. HMWF019]|nr:acetate/propionate family kinase [Pedobacter sp. HMWF019]